MEPADNNLDIPCINCRYNLRGIPIDHPCPECGIKILRSVTTAIRSSINSHSQDNYPQNPRLFVPAATVSGHVVDFLIFVFDAVGGADTAPRIMRPEYSARDICIAVR